jgi:hypothetical protein
MDRKLLPVMVCPTMIDDMGSDRPDLGPKLCGTRRPFTSVAFSPDGNASLALTALMEPSLCLKIVIFKKRHYCYKVLQSAIRAISFSQMANRLLCKRVRGSAV